MEPPLINYLRLVVASFSVDAEVLVLGVLADTKNFFLLLLHASEQLRVSDHRTQEKEKGLV